MNLAIEFIKADNGYIVRVTEPTENQSAIYVADDDTKFKQTLGRIINEYLREHKAGRKSDPAPSAEAD